AGPRAVKEFRQDDPFSMFALTWQGHKDVAAFVRAEQEDGSWGEWFSAEPMDVTTEGTNGTDLIFVGNTNAVQVSVGNVDLGIPSDQEVSEELDSAEAETETRQPLFDYQNTDVSQADQVTKNADKVAQRIDQQVTT